MGKEFLPEKINELRRKREKTEMWNMATTCPAKRL